MQPKQGDQFCNYSSTPVLTWGNAIKVVVHMVRLLVERVLKRLQKTRTRSNSGHTLGIWRTPSMGRGCLSELPWTGSDRGAQTYPLSPSCTPLPGVGGTQLGCAQCIPGAPPSLVHPLPWWVGVGAQHRGHSTGGHSTGPQHRARASCGCGLSSPGGRAGGWHAPALPAPACPACLSSGGGGVPLDRTQRGTGRNSHSPSVRVSEFGH